MTLTQGRVEVHPEDWVSSIIRRERLSPTALRIVVTLADDVFETCHVAAGHPSNPEPLVAPGRHKLAARLEVNGGTVQGHLLDLIARGWLVKTRPGGRAMGQRAQYKLVIPPVGR